MSSNKIVFEDDPVIEVYKKDIDRTLIRRNLRLTPEERIRKLEAHIAGIASLKANAKFLGKYEEWRDKSE